MSDLTGQVIGQFQIEKLLGQGGMGAVYRARDVQLNRSVAFKIMHPEIGAHEDLRKRFIQEARAIAALDHPNIIRVYTFHAEKDEMYLVMEYVASGSLRDYLKKLQAEKNFMEITEAISLIKQVASALNYSHEQGMIHRDVKPDNVLLKPSSLTGGASYFNALLTDFGLAKLADQAMVQTAGHNPMGTLPYMPPEQIRGEAVDARADLYALGIMFYELLVGRLPFTPRNIPEAARMHGFEEPPMPSSLREGISPELELIMLRAIAKAPAERFQTGNEMIAAIENLEKGAKSADTEDYLATFIDPKLLDKKKQVNMATYLASMPIGSEPDIAKMPIAPAGTASDQVAIVKQGGVGEPTFVPITKQALTIGRDPASDIPLTTGEKVSRNHARIERQPDGNYTITDLGSTNGTFLDNVKLLSNVAERWQDNQVVTVGEFRLSIQRAKMDMTVRAVQDVKGVVPNVPDMQHGILGRPQTPFQPPQVSATPVERPKVAVQVMPPAITVDPGMQMSAQVEIFNQSDIVEHYRVQIQGIPNEWFTSPPMNLQLLPGNRGTLPLVFHPPRIPKSTAGTHPFSVRITSEERGMEVGRGNGMITVNPFYQYIVDMDPKRLRKKGMLKFIITNQGNSTDSYTVFGRDREDSLQFFPPSTSGSVGAGLAEALQFEVRPKRGNFIGTTKTYPLELQAEAASGRAQSVPGELVQKPTLPIWLLMLLLLLCLLLCLLLYFLYPREEPTITTPEDLQPITLTNADIRELLTATAERFVTREAEIIETATAQALEDNDDDGLTNAEEAELGTDPDNEDTDGDGLTDWEEVNETDTDPLDADSDDDGLKDGEEIDDFKTDPNNDDSDRDGLKDGEEITEHNTIPDRADTDGDGVLDGQEITDGTNPNDRDTDGDGRADGSDAFPLDPSQK